MLLHRYVRLTPLLVLSMLMSDVVASLLDDVSVHRQFLRDDLVCSQWVISWSIETFWKRNIHSFWWRNILYIHNLFPYAEQCLTWSWSLACDMQFFIVTTLILMIYIRFVWRFIFRIATSNFIWFIYSQKSPTRKEAFNNFDSCHDNYQLRCSHQVQICDHNGRDESLVRGSIHGAIHENLSISFRNIDSDISAG